MALRKDAISKKTAAKIEKLAEGVLKTVGGGKNPFLDIPVRSLANVSWSEKRRLVDRRNHDLRAVDGQQIRAAHAIEVNIADTVAAANDCPRIHGVCDSQARRKVVAIRLHQRAVEYAAIFGCDDFARRRVEIGEAVFGFPVRRRVFVAQSEIQSELLAYLEIVLPIKEVHAASHLRDEQAGQLIFGARAEIEVGEIVGSRVRSYLRRSAGRGRRRGNAAKCAAIDVATVKRIHVLHFGVNHLQLVPGLQRVAAAYGGEYELRIDQERILPLRVGRLTSQCSESRDLLPGKTAGDARIAWQAGDAVRAIPRSRCRCRQPQAAG